MKNRLDRITDWGALAFNAEYKLAPLARFCGLSMCAGSCSTNTTPGSRRTNRWPWNLSQTDQREYSGQGCPFEHPHR